MRAYEFLIEHILVEYKREPTARTYGDKILDRVSSLPLHDLPDDLYTANTVINLVKNPQAYDWGDEKKRLLWNGELISIGVDNAKEILEKIKPRTVEIILKMLEDYDPTPNKVFVPWLAREWARGNIRRGEDIESRLVPLMKDYIQFKNKKDFPQEAKDIMRLSAGDFERILTAYDPPEKQERQRGEYKTVLDNDIARVIIPENEEAACYYGQGTRWCTAATRGSNMFNSYNRTGPLYIILPKQPKYDGEKYQLHFYDEQFMDENDDPVDLQWLLAVRFPELQETFKKIVPQITEYVSFAQDEVLTAIWKLIGESVQDFVWEQLSEWEANDDYFREWQKEQAIDKGYVDDDGDVDWDKVYEDDDLNNYLEFNDDARRYLRDFESVNAPNITGKDIKRFAHSIWEDGDIDGTPSISDLEEVFAKMIDQEISSENGALMDYINSNYWVRKGIDQTSPRNSRVLGTVGDWTVGKIRG